MGQISKKENINKKKLFFHRMDFSRLGIFADRNGNVFRYFFKLVQTTKIDITLFIIPLTYFFFFVVLFNVQQCHFSIFEEVSKICICKFSCHILRILAIFDSQWKICQKTESFSKAEL